jgi:peptide/nickel transport system ATP-binding protein
MAMLLNIDNLSVLFTQDDVTNTVVNALSFHLEENEILGIVGESGSGKSVTALAILGLLPRNAKVKGSIEFDQMSLLTLSPGQFREIRGKRIAMIFQEPMSSLNPSLTCGFQVREMLMTHEKLNRIEAKKEVLSLFEQVKLPRVSELYNQYPHQLSGGQKQRVMIAMAIACKPSILIADEPTTALDVTVQKDIIELLKELQEQTKMSVIFITHDLALVSEIADNILVMYKGKIVERGSIKEVFINPSNNYTKALIKSKPGLSFRLKRLPTVENFMEGDFNAEIYTQKERAQFHEKIYGNKPLLEIKDLATYFSSGRSNFLKSPGVVKAVDDVSLKLYEGETLGLVGESGCGKTTLGRTLLHLEKATKGIVFYRGKDVTNLKGNALKRYRRAVQIIFQDPFSSLNPRMPVGKAIMEPMAVHGIEQGKAARKNRVMEILDKVGLEQEHFYRYPHEFSGGQRQRIGIARAVALKPELIICDESVSALDVSVQAQVLNLLNQLKRDFGFTYIFISHDLSVVKFMADQLAVMNNGKIEEIGEADTIYKSPKSMYTRKLIEAIPKGL